MEERLQFLATGAKPKKNTEAMKEVLDELKKEGFYYEAPATKKKDKKKKKRNPKILQDFKRKMSVDPRDGDITFSNCNEAPALRRASAKK